MSQQIEIKEVIAVKDDAQSEYDREIIAVTVTSSEVQLRFRRNPTHDEWKEVVAAADRAFAVLRSATALWGDRP